MSQPRQTSVMCPQRVATVVASTREYEVPVRKISFLSGQLCIPAFEEQVRTWMGISEVVIQFNYSAGSKFVIIDSIEAPEEPTFCPVVAWLESNSGIKQRFKLWSNVGELLPVPLLYSNQEIHGEFSIEIWNVEGENAALAEELCYLTSLFRCRELGDDTSATIYEADSGDSISPFFVDMTSLPLIFVDDVPHSN